MNLQGSVRGHRAVSETKENLLFDVCDFLLLLVVRFHLIHFVLRLRPDKCGIITTVIHQLKKRNRSILRWT